LIRKAELVVDAQAWLGEGPAWDARTQNLYWVDILAGKLHIFRHVDRVLELGESVSAVAPCRSGGVILTMGRAFCRLDPDSGAVSQLAVPDGELDENRFNDGKCDAAGRFLAGTMNRDERQPTGSLYSLDPGGTITRLLTGVTISNGIAWSPDHRTLYYIDTPTREVHAFDYDLETGLLANRRSAIRVPAEMGWPDGMTSDTSGCLWIALWGGASVTRWDPQSGEPLEQVHLPALNVSSCVFGGEELNDLYITSARAGLDEATLQEYPQSGGLFRLSTNAVGMPTFEFGA